jgi:mRNA interferase MazF
MGQCCRRCGICRSVSSLGPFAVVRVPFPFSDRNAQKRRPALVLSQLSFQQRSGHLLLAMITSANQSCWPLDWLIEGLEPTGLRQPCLVRMKLFTLDERLLLGQLGALAQPDRLGVSQRLQSLLPTLESGEA